MNERNEFRVRIPTPSIRALVSYLVLGLGIFMLLGSLSYLRVADVAGPIGDHWPELKRLFPILDGVGSWSDLTFFHGANRLLVERVVMLEELKRFGGSNELTRWISVALVTFYLFVHVLLVKRTSILSGSEKIVLVGLAAGVIGYRQIAYDLPWNTNWAWTLIFFAVALFFMSQRKISVFGLVSAVTCAILAHWSAFIGGASWIALTIVSFLRRNVLASVVVIIGGIVNFQLYLKDWAPASMEAGFKPIGYLVAYLVKILGLPLGLSFPLLSYAIGALGFVLSFLVVYRVSVRIWRGSSSQFEVFHYGMLLFLSGAILATAIGRYSSQAAVGISIGDYLVPPDRYAPPVVFWWYSVLSLILVQSTAASRYKIRQFAYYALPVWLCLFVFPHHATAINGYHYQTANIRRSLIHYMIALELSSPEASLFFDQRSRYYERKIEIHIPNLKKFGVAAFSEPYFSSIREQNPHPIEASSICKQSNPKVSETFSKDEPKSVYFSGSFKLSDATGGQVIVLNEQKQIVGLGLPMEIHGNLIQKSFLPLASSRGWNAIAAAGHQIYDFYLVNGHDACHLGLYSFNLNEHEGTKSALNPTHGVLYSHIKAR